MIVLLQLIHLFANDKLQYSEVVVRLTLRFLLQALYEFLPFLIRKVGTNDQWVLLLVSEEECWHLLSLGVSDMQTHLVVQNNCLY